MKLHFFLLVQLGGAEDSGQCEHQQLTLCVSVRVCVRMSLTFGGSGMWREGGYIDPDLVDRMLNLEVQKR